MLPIMDYLIKTLKKSGFVKEKISEENSCKTFLAIKKGPRRALFCCG
jgi:hypothetical protein